MTSSEIEKIKNLNRKIEALEDQLTLVGFKFSKLSDYNDEISKKNHQLELKNNELTSNIIKIQSSKSWKFILFLSAPYRNLRRVYRKFKRYRRDREKSFD